MKKGTLQQDVTSIKDSRGKMLKNSKVPIVIKEINEEIFF